MENCKLNIKFRWAWSLINDGWTLTGYLESITSQVQCFSVSKESKEIAVGTAFGSILIFNILTSVLEYKFDLFQTPLKGIIWISLTKLICIFFFKIRLYL
jgi:hypothetical protein